MKKKLLALLLCAALLCTALASCAVQEDVHDHEDEDIHTELPDDDVPMTSGVCDGRHDMRTVGSIDIDDCVMGKCNVKVQQCSVCGFTYHLAARPYGNAKNGTHSYTEVTTDTTCPKNPAKAKVCSTCKSIVFVSAGGHNWGEWKDVDGGNACTSGQVRECKDCGQTETKGATGHSWRLVKSTPATCTEPATEVQECNRCHTTRTVEKSPALGHNFGGLTDCTVERKCVRCNETKPAGSHSWGEYVMTDEGHYQRCALCSQTTEMAAHTDNGSGYCSVCGYKMKANAPTPPACSHDYQVVKGSASAGSHTEKCSKCGATRRVACADHPDYTSRQYCTDPLYCVCGAKISDGQKNHNFGTSSGWTTTSTKHERHCLNTNCQYVEEGEHTYNPTTNCTVPAKCTVCGYANGAAASKEHAWSAWIDNGFGSHTRHCTNDGCIAMESAPHTVSSGSADCTADMLCVDCGAVIVEGSDDHAWGHPVSAGDGGHNQSCTHPDCDAKRNSAHEGGTATCVAPARCTVCGDFYGEKDPANHTGATEIRNAKAAEVGETGYTGDVYCVDCGALLSEGQEIPALEPAHTHSYSAGWRSDKDNHWHECECGDRQSQASHTYSNGFCTVCGAKDPNYVPHVHTFTDTWSADSQNHWRVCTSCGEKVDVAKHSFAKKDGVDQCVGCGLTRREGYIDKALEVYKDIKAGDWYSDSVGWAFNAGIANGTDVDKETGLNLFSATDTCTELQILTMLYRAEGEGHPHASMDEALAWAKEMGMVGEDFDPNTPCTRAAAVTYMWLAAGRPDAPESVPFKDVPADADFAAAVAWAVSRHITGGVGDDLFAPDTICTRGQIVTFLYRANNGEE